MRWALQANKNIILVAETDERHGKADIDPSSHWESLGFQVHGGFCDECDMLVLVF